MRLRPTYSKGLRVLLPRLLHNRVFWKKSDFLSAVLGAEV